ncbi:coiled-coil domain-containing protein 138 isoform X4 [Phaenicophaeus curvirostris]|uniref:coiled-coil domain-containing protein 138 isoform X4 n=1 Tax=Phaenicophaeus curvirostris TaxID=33595 RepID=UPI0037F0CFE5
MDSSLENTTVSLSKCSSESEFTESERENSIRSFNGFLRNFEDWDCFDDEQDCFSDSSGLEIEEKAVNCFETGSTLPSRLAASARENGDQNIINGLIRKILSGTGAQACNNQGLIPPHINQIYGELFIIHQKLQRESSAQREYALQLQKRERFLTEREALLFGHEAALAKIRGVEEEVHTKFGIIKEQHEAEVKQLTEALREITKENRRLKLSFDTLKEMNDSLRKQLNDVTELNKKLEGQARKVQARLENLQRKHEFLMVRKSKDICQVVQRSKPVKQEKATVTSKIAKLPLNSQVYELLTFLMDWISDQHLSKMKIQEEREDSCRFTVAQTSKKTCTQERCMKLLPLAAEQLQWMPFVNPKLHMPVIKFIYWSIRQLDTGVQHAIMTSTMRRLGEDIFKGVVSKGNPHISSEQSTESKSKSAAFFKSSCLPLRFLSTLIVLKTVTQGSLQFFLEACSNESFFRTCSALLRSSKLDVQILEKLGVLLQKLSRIKSNKKMFELFNLHQMIQELHRTANPDDAFLCINLNSILLNLGLSRSNSLTSSLSTSP